MRCGIVMEFNAFHRMHFFANEVQKGRMHSCTFWLLLKEKLWKKIQHLDVSWRHLSGIYHHQFVQIRSSRMHTNMATRNEGLGWLCRQSQANHTQGGGQFLSHAGSLLGQSLIDRHLFAAPKPVQQSVPKCGHSVRRPLRPSRFALPAPSQIPMPNEKPSAKKNINRDTKTHQTERRTITGHCILCFVQLCAIAASESLSHRTLLYLGPICSGHWQPVTSPHTLIPAQPSPLPVFSFLLPVVPPECIPKLQLSTAKSQKLMQEKETAICIKTTPPKNMFCGTLIKNLMNPKWNKHMMTPDDIHNHTPS